VEQACPALHDYPVVVIIVSVRFTRSNPAMKSASPRPRARLRPVIRIPVCLLARKLLFSPFSFIAASNASAVYILRQNNPQLRDPPAPRLPLRLTTVREDIGNRRYAQSCKGGRVSRGGQPFLVRCAGRVMQPDAKSKPASRNASTSTARPCGADGCHRAFATPMTNGSLRRVLSPCASQSGQPRSALHPSSRIGRQALAGRQSLIGLAPTLASKMMLGAFRPLKRRAVWCY